MPSWLIWMFGVGGYVAGWIITTWLLVKAEGDTDDETIFLWSLVGIFWPFVLPVIGITTIVKGMAESVERRIAAESRRKKAEECQKDLEEQCREMKALAEVWYKKAIEAEEANKALAEQYNRVVEGGSK